MSFIKWVIGSSYAPDCLEGLNADAVVGIVTFECGDDMFGESRLLLEGGAARRLQALPRIGRRGRGEHRRVKVSRRS